MSGNEQQFKTFTLERATPTIGAYIHGLDLREEITPDAGRNYGKLSLNTKYCFSAISTSRRMIKSNSPRFSATPRK
ncbi:hypothetical protein [Paenarthrobacter aurescens]|uniref:hypothetical protein n=1 Tax=Paenarthrobacter aurescens TaxID=43663 RepID=UPI001EE27202|nr:hypothetical protein [Paenarthrobacter aurescens]